MVSLRTFRVGILSVCISFHAYALDRVNSVAESAGEIVSVSGNALIRQENQKGKSEAPFQLKPGQNVYAGDVINTGSDGAVKILLKDKSIVDVGASALFKVEKFKLNHGSDREVDLDMKFGKMRIGVSKKITGQGKFNIKTRAITMGVRGTELVISSALDAPVGNKTEVPKTEVTVLQGKVDVAKVGISQNTPSVQLTAGTQISSQSPLNSGGMVKLNDVQMSTVSNTSKVADNTFTKAVTIEPTQESRAQAQASSSSPSSSSSTSSTAAAASSSSSSSGTTKDSKDSKDANGNAPASNSTAASNNSSGSGSSAARAPAEIAGGPTQGQGNNQAPPAAPMIPALPGSFQSTIAGMAASVPTVNVSFSELGVPGAPSVVTAANPTNRTNRSYHVTVKVSQ